MPYQLLIVEDDETLRETLEYNLRNQGYGVITADNGYAALELARGRQPDLLLLDLMLPGIDGIEVCRILRKEMSLPILMLTARTEEVDKIIGLEVGADDYLTKPFSMRELLARVKALLRRVELVREEMISQGEVQPDGGRPVLDTPPTETLTFGNLAIDDTRREVRIDGRPIRVRPKEFDLLLFLARHRGIALSRDLILERVWGWEFDGGSRTVDVHVRWLREKIERNPSDPQRIVTVRSVGYRFEG